MALHDRRVARFACAGRAMSLPGTIATAGRRWRAGVGRAPAKTDAEKPTLSGEEEGDVMEGIPIPTANHRRQAEPIAREKGRGGQPREDAR